MNADETRLTEKFLSYRKTLPDSCKIENGNHAGACVTRGHVCYLRIAKIIQATGGREYFRYSRK